MKGRDIADKPQKRYSVIISPDLLMRAEKQAKADGITIPELIVNNLPPPEPRRDRAAFKTVQFMASEAVMNKLARCGQWPLGCGRSNNSPL
jgi:hypothetical protein